MKQIYQLFICTSGSPSVSTDWNLEYEGTLSDCIIALKKRTIDVLDHNECLGSRRIGGLENNTWLWDFSFKII
jgi:hypothetical protein